MDMLLCKETLIYSTADEVFLFLGGEGELGKLMVMARIFTERNWDEYPDGKIILNERKIRPGWDWVENRVVLLRGDERQEFRFSHRPYSAVELSQLLKQSGFASVEVCGGLDGSPYNHTAKRLVAVARKE